MTLKLNGSTGGSVSIDAPAATTGNADITFSLPVADGSNGQVLQTNGSGQLSFGSGSQWTTTGSDIYYTGGSVGIGTASPSRNLHVHDAGANNVYLQLSNSTTGSGTTDGLQLFCQGSTGEAAIIQRENQPLAFWTNNNEKVRIDSSGRLLVGTSSAIVDNTHGKVQLASDGGGTIVLGRNTTSVSSSENLALIRFYSFAGSTYEECARISAVADGTQGSGDKPTALLFMTTLDNNSSPTERMKIANNGNLTCLGVYTETSAQAANVYVGSTGNIQRSTSSVKYKTDVEDMQDVYADSILQCRPVWYRSTCLADNPEWGWWGFIAEEVAKIDPRLVHWKTVEVTYDENGSAVETPCNPEPEGVAYERFVPHLLNLIKRQKEQIEAMEARLTALEGGTN